MLLIVCSFSEEANSQKLESQTQHIAIFSEPITYNYHNIEDPISIFLLYMNNDHLSIMATIQGFRGHTECISYLPISFTLQFTLATRTRRGTSQRILRRLSVIIDRLAGFRPWSFCTARSEIHSSRSRRTRWRRSPGVAGSAPTGPRYLDSLH